MSGAATRTYMGQQAPARGAKHALCLLPSVPDNEDEVQDYVIIHDL